VFTLDHNVQDTSEKNLNKYRKIEEFAREMGVDFYPAGRGIGHQIMCEEGYAWPGTVVVASDSHSNMYGGFGCLGTPIVRTDAAALWATGQTWWQVPPVARVRLEGQMHPGVTGKDVIITLAGYFNKDEVLNHAIEFIGDGIVQLSLDQRLTIANMTTEWGALAGVFPVDDVTLKWLDSRIAYIEKRGLAGVPSDADGNGVHPRLNRKHLEELQNNTLHSDRDAYYAKELTLDLSTIVPYASGPNSVKVMHPVSELRNNNVKIDKAYLVSCVNSRVEDLAEAARVIRGRKVAPHVKFYIAAASDEVQKESTLRGDWDALIEAGAIPLPPGCGPCIGLGTGLLEEGELGISATNRNFKGRMGSPKAQAYLSSPAVVAASAASGIINLPFDYEPVEIKGSYKTTPRPEAEKSPVKLLPSFPDIIEGELVFCHQDNLNTDGIYPGKYTYMDEITPDQQSNVVMENYDPEFANIVSEGDILVGGFNFGTGSSREQAATALKYKGVKLVFAGSFSETYKRNAINNGFLVIEAPELVGDLKERFGTKKLTVKTGIRARIRFTDSTLKAGEKQYEINPLGLAAQEILVAGGLERWVEERLRIK
jgi:homoaconitate hydratase